MSSLSNHPPLFLIPSLSPPSAAVSSNFRPFISPFQHTLSYFAKSQSKSTVKTEGVPLMVSELRTALWYKVITQDCFCWWGVSDCINNVKIIQYVNLVHLQVPGLGWSLYSQHTKLNKEPKHDFQWIKSIYKSPSSADNCNRPKLYQTMEMTAVVLPLLWARAIAISESWQSYQEQSNWSTTPALLWFIIHFCYSFFSFFLVYQIFWIVENAHHRISEAKVMSSNCLFSSNNSPKPTDFEFTTI